MSASVNIRSDIQMTMYPYPKNRVYLSTIIAGLSIILALILLVDYPILTGYYFLSTIAFTALTFLLKKRLYSSIQMEENDEETGEIVKRTPWKALLLVLFMTIAVFVAPLLLAKIASGSAWFIIIASFTSGISISEMILYLQMRTKT